MVPLFNLSAVYSRGGLEVEQWSDNRTLSISVDQFPLGARMIIWYQWTAMLCTSWMCVVCVCKLKDYIIQREIEERLYEHYSQANYGINVGYKIFCGQEPEPEEGGDRRYRKEEKGCSGLS